MSISKDMYDKIQAAIQRDPELDKLLAGLPLRQNVKWINLSYLFPGRVIEATKNPKNDNKFGAIDLEDPALAAKVVEYHNANMKVVKVSGFTYHNWQFIALVLENRVTFLFDRNCKCWTRRKMLDLNGDCIDSLWGLEVEGNVNIEADFDELAQEVVTKLWIECQGQLDCSDLEAVTTESLAKGAGRDT